MTTQSGQTQNGFNSANGVIRELTKKEIAQQAKNLRALQGAKF